MDIVYKTKVRRDGDRYAGFDLTAYDGCNTITKIRLFQPKPSDDQHLNYSIQIAKIDTVKDFNQLKGRSYGSV